MRYASAHDMQRLEIGFGEISDTTIKAYENRCSWLGSLGWDLVEDTNFMTVDSLQDIPDSAVPEGFKLQPLLQIDDDELYKCHYAAFTTSKAREFYGLTDEEKKQHFDNLYDRTQEINSDASWVLKHGEKLASILLVISRENEEYISVIAVHPDFRGKGLAKTMLSASMKKLRDNGVKNISIGVDTFNTPAIQLYQKYGFQATSRLSFHAWKAKTR
jgi:ribosomal protein S18 acetylase RimI-like enzyme